MFHEHDIWLMIIPSVLLTRYAVDLIKPVGKAHLIVVVTSMFFLNIFMIGMFLGFLRANPGAMQNIGRQLLMMFQ